MRRSSYTYTNHWISSNKIPLGVMDDEAPFSEDNFVFKILPKHSDFFLISAKTGRGKSVLFRLIIWFIAQVRPVIVIDWEGEDHKLSFFPNDSEENLPPYTFTAGIKNAIYLKYPQPRVKSMTLEKLEHQTEILPSLYDYSSEELRGMGFPPAASSELKRIITEYTHIQTMDGLLNFIKQFPTNSKESWAIKQKYGRSHYHDNDYLDKKSKPSLVRVLQNLIENRQFCLDKERSVVLRNVAKGNHIFIDYSGNIDLARTDAAKIVDEVILYRKMHPEGYKPYIFIEEADRLMPRQVSDSQERKKTEYVKNVVVQAVLRARKAQIGIGVCSPTLVGLDPLIISQSYEKLFGEIDSQVELDEVRRCTNKYIMEKVKELKFNRYKNVRQFLYRNEFKNDFIFYPYACPQLFHKEK